MDPRSCRRCVSFSGNRLVAAGDIATVAAKTKSFLDRNVGRSALLFDEETSELVEADFRGTQADVLRRLAVEPQTASQNRSKDSEHASQISDQARGPGRPKLGVIAREVTLLPRHWEWLNDQPGGASVALRKLVEDARRTYAERDRLRKEQEAAYRFLSAMAGNFTGFEEASRALFAGDARRFGRLVESWPAGVRDHALLLAARSFANGN
jgi:hypothetical protein